MDITAEILVEIAIEVLVVLLDWGVRNLIYYYIVVQAGLGFNINTNTTSCLTVAER